MPQRILQELTYLFSGLSFYTRIPCPAWVEYSPDNLNKSRKYLPLIGLFIGAFAALVYALCEWLLPTSISIALSMIFTVVLTGAFHEDGLADCADGFGGGWDKAQILTIMKDSRMGAYGTISLVLILGLKFLLLYELTLVSAEALLLGLMVGHTLSRLMPSFIMQFYDYVSELSTSKSKTVTSLRLNHAEMAFSCIPVLLLVVFTWPIMLGLCLLVLLLFTGFLGSYFKKRIGGYTGDCLGAIQQLTEVLVYLVLVM